MQKPFLPLAEQVALLRSRGLDVGNADEAAATLHRLNYYRLSGFGRQFQVSPSNGDEAFRNGLTLARLCDLMEMDTRLRSLFGEALAVLELEIRSRFAYEAGNVLGSHAFYLDEAAYLDITPGLVHHIGKLARELSRPKLRTVERYRVGDDLSLVPIWVAIELITFGALAKTLWYLVTPIPAHRTADAIGVQRTGFASTVHSFAVLRNICAHHGQLWHRSFDVMFSTWKKEKKSEPAHDPAGPYSAVIATKRFLKALDRMPDWSSRIDELLDSDADFREGILWPRPR